MTPAALKQLRFDTLMAQYDIVKSALTLYRLAPTEIGETQLRTIKTNADLYKKKYNL